MHAPTRPLLPGMLPETLDTVARLEAAMASPAITARDAEACARLTERLTRPVRVGLFGLQSSGAAQVLRGLLGADPVPEGYLWPTMEIAHAEEPRTVATLGDATQLEQPGLPGPDLMEQAPVFLSLGAPMPGLARMSFLFLAAGDGPQEQISALTWAENRVDIALWCTQDFSDTEARIWTSAPDRLKNHAFLVATGWQGSETELTDRAGYDFEGAFEIPLAANGLPLSGHDAAMDRLLRRLNDDIDVAHRADIDAALMFLHRLGDLPPAPEAAKDTTAEAPQETHEENPSENAAQDVLPTPEAAPEPEPEAAEADAPEATPQHSEVGAPAAPAAVTPLPRPPARPSADPEAIAHLGEPLLYLKRRARALMEMLDWQGEEAEDWPGEVLRHCSETTEGLRERALDWPEDNAVSGTLRESLDEACDMTVLLQLEGGAEQAHEAATLLLQLRGEFERGLAA